MEQPAAGQMRRIRLSVQTFVTQWLELAESLLLIGVAAVLLLAGLVILFETGKELIQAIAAHDLAGAIVDIAENALLALILAELVHTLLVALHGGPLTPEPFLVVGIVAVVRKMLIESAVIVKAESPGLISPLVAELALLGLLTLFLAAALALVRWRWERSS